jgi:hypothetical protein
MRIPLRRKHAIALVGASLIAAATAVAPGASAASLSLPPICSAVPGSYPGATIVVGAKTVHVNSISNINVCVYRYAITTVGTPLPQKVSGCGIVCYKIDTPNEGVAFAPKVQITFDADGNPKGLTEQPGPYSVVIDEPLCISVGSPAPGCSSGKLNLNENI